ncbi:MAG: hypothetical protein U5L01_05095 [Rheinheimera sp.]|nr:hypothetical protein [Rheinheimera sp.]
MLNRLAQRLLLVLLTTFSALTFAKPNSTEPPALCPENYTEQLNTTSFASAQLLVCVSQHEINGLKQLQVSFINAKQQLHSIMPLDVEGELRAIRLASAPYALKPGLRAVALVLALRNRGVGFDEERQELWLFWPKENALNLVFNQTIELQRWATNCTQDCEDTLQSKSELVVLSQSSGPITASSELVPLELRSQDHVTPADVGGKNTGEVDTNEVKADMAKTEHFLRTERYEFNGERYELVPTAK